MLLSFHSWWMDSLSVALYSFLLVAISGGIFWAIHKLWIQNIKSDWICTILTILLAAFIFITTFLTGFLFIE